MLALRKSVRRRIVVLFKLRELTIVGTPTGVYIIERRRGEGGGSSQALDH